MMNNGIQNLWKAHRKDLEMTTKFDKNLGEYMGAVSGVSMEAPRIQIEWQPNDSSQVMYFMKFNSGKLTVSGSRGNSPSPNHAGSCLTTWWRFKGQQERS